MIKLFTTKDKKKTENGDANAPRGNQPTACELRLQKDFSDLALPKNITISFPEGREKLTHFEIIIRPDEGIYKNGQFLFEFNISSGYPHDAPKVLCKTKVFHPNIDLEGKICLNILREDWKPVLSISSVIYGLQFLFLDPNPDDPLNKEAAQMFTDNPKSFEMNVQRSIIHGAVIQNLYFPPCQA